MADAVPCRPWWPVLVTDRGRGADMQGFLHRTLRVQLIVLVCAEGRRMEEHDLPAEQHCLRPTSSRCPPNDVSGGAEEEDEVGSLGEATASTSSMEEEGGNVPALMWSPMLINEEIRFRLQRQDTREDLRVYPLTAVDAASWVMHAHAARLPTSTLGQLLCSLPAQVRRECYLLPAVLQACAWPVKPFLHMQAAWGVRWRSRQDRAPTFYRGFMCTTGPGRHSRRAFSDWVVKRLFRTRKFRARPHVTPLQPTQELSWPHGQRVAPPFRALTS